MCRNACALFNNINKIFEQLNLALCLAFFLNLHLFNEEAYSRIHFYLVVLFLYIILIYENTQKNS